MHLFSNNNKKNEKRNINSRVRYYRTRIYKPTHTYIYFLMHMKRLS